MSVTPTLHMAFDSQTRGDLQHSSVDSDFLKSTIWSLPLFVLPLQTDLFLHFNYYETTTRHAKDDGLQNPIFPLGILEKCFVNPLVSRSQRTRI
jgi:hypothetical protein